MTITTKFNINDEVWFIRPSTQKAIKGKIEGVAIKVDSEVKYIHDDKKGLIRTKDLTPKERSHVYAVYVNSDVRINEYEHLLFPNKQELIDSL